MRTALWVKKDNRLGVGLTLKAIGGYASRDCSGFLTIVTENATPTRTTPHVYIKRW